MNFSEANSSFRYLGAVKTYAALSLVVLAACSRGGDAATDAAAASVAPSASAAVVASAAPSASVAPGHVITTPCSFPLDTPATTIDKVTSADIARAVIPTLDPKSMIAPTQKDGTIVSCESDHAAAGWEGTKIPKGKVQVKLRQSIGNGRELAWLLTGEPQGACTSPTGFLAVVHLDGTTVVADGVGAWDQLCGEPTKMRGEKLGGGEVYVESGHMSTGAGTQTFEDLWALHMGKVVKLGTYEVGEDSGGVEDSDGWLASMTSKVEVSGADVILHESWTWQSTKLKDGGGPLVKTKTNDRKYTLMGQTLKLMSPDGPPKRPT